MPHTKLLNALYVVLGAYESCAIPPLRRVAMEKCYQLICREDENTGYQTLGPVSKMMNLIVRALVDGRESEAYKLHMKARDDFMWVSGQGMNLSSTILQVTSLLHYAFRPLTRDASERLVWWILAVALVSAHVLRNDKRLCTSCTS